MPLRRAEIALYDGATSDGRFLAFVAPHDFALLLSIVIGVGWTGAAG
jgi:hypothetical protein